MSGTLDVRGLLQQAYFSTEVTNATQALEEAHKRFIDKHRSDGLSFELVVPGQPDAEWLREKVLRPLVYFCASRGSPAPSCPGVFVAFFMGTKLHCVTAAEVIGWASRALGTSADELASRYGLHESETTAR